MFLRAVGAICLVACRAGSSGPTRDPHSSAEPDRIAVKHLALDLGVDFKTRTLGGTARLELERHAGDVVVLDSDHLSISGITTCADQRRLQYHLDGTALRITLGGAACIVIAYAAASDAGALLWVEPAGTAGGTQPMLFTQSEPTYARTWIPLQDSPSVRFTYRATIHAPPGTWALMSASNPQAISADGVYTFEQAQPIPSYLMALAAGDFAFKAIGPRTGVYAEPHVVDAAASEFVEIEAMISAAERIYGPYRWGRYDMLVLPPSFPFGGMENPNLTFLTPTVLSGDRALVSLIAHELAHSWSGNLATNKTWNDLWLNEGFTSYVENRIMEEVRGREYVDLLWYLTRRSLDHALAERGPRNQASRLSHAYGREVSADDIPSEFAYDKGALFLLTLERAYGRPKFDAFLKGWFDRHAFSSVDSKMFQTEATAELGTKVNLAEWLYEPGLPASAVATPSSRAGAIGKLATDFAAGADLVATDWTTLDWTVFLRALPENIPVARLEALDAKYQLVNGNAEIQMHWLPLLVAADVRTAAPAVEKFLMTVGRARMVNPVYAAMKDKNDFWRQLARATYERAKPRYHPIVRSGIGKMLAVP